MSQFQFFSLLSLIALAPVMSWWASLLLGALYLLMAFLAWKDGR